MIHNPRWKPPENVYTAASDVYCFGLIMWEIVSRKIPFFELNWPSVIEDKILLGERPSIDGLDMRADYTRLMRRCWAQKMEDRPNAMEVVGGIEAIRSAL